MFLNLITKSKYFKKVSHILYLSNIYFTIRINLISNKMLCSIVAIKFYQYFDKLIE